MTRSRPTPRRLAVATALGALFVIAFIGFLTYVGTDFLTDGRTVKAPDIEVAAEPVAASTEGGTPMSLHAAPRPLPEFRFANDAGEPMTLADFRGKLVLLNVWATWCGPCRAEMPTLDRLQSKLGGADFEVVALSIDRGGIGVVNDFYDEIGIEHLARYIDDSGKAARELNAVGLPTTLLVDREGREIARHVGPAEWDTPEMVTFLRQQLGRESEVLLPQPAGKRAHARADAPAVPSVPHRNLRAASLPAAAHATSSAIAKGNSR